MTAIKSYIQDDDTTFIRSPYVYGLGIEFKTPGEAMAFLLAPDAEVLGLDKENNQGGFISKICGLFTGNSPSDPTAGQYKQSGLSDWTNVVKNMSGSMSMRPNQTDTSLGGNEAINCFYGFNEDDDIILPLLAINGDHEQGGLGCVYNEIYEVGAPLLHLNFGVPVFNNMADFYSYAMESTTADFVNTGYTNASWASTLGTVVGSLLTHGLIVSFPIVSIPYCFSLAIGKIGDILTDGLYVSKYYELKSAMPQYYRYVNTIMITLATNMRLRPDDDTGGSSAISGGSQANLDYSDTMQKTAATLTVLNEVSNMSDSEKEEFLSSIDVDPSFYNMGLTASGGDSTGITSSSSSSSSSSSIAIEQTRSGTLTKNYKDESVPSFLGGDFSVYSLLAKRDNRAYTTTGYPFEDNEENDDFSIDNLGGDLTTYACYYDRIKADPDAYYHDNSADDSAENGKGFNFFSQLRARYYATIHMADHVVTFRINKNTSVGETVSNTVGESTIAGFLNNVGSAGKEARFGLFGGNLGSGGVINAVESAIGGAKDFIGSFIEGLPVIGGASSTSMTAVTGMGTFDIPDVWKSSSFSKSYSFDVVCRSPYGDPLSIYQSCYVPLAFLLAGTLPRSVGVNSYTSPFLCRGYVTGKVAACLAMIENLNISRGASEFGYSRANLPLEIKLSFSLRDLSPSMHLAMGGTSTFFDEILRSNSNMNEYMMTLSAMGLKERLLWWQSVKRKINTVANIFRSTYANPNFWGTELGNTAIGKIHSALQPVSLIGS